MGALAMADGFGLPCAGGIVATYGGGRRNEEYLEPCRDRDGRWGCGSFCKQSQVTPVTKRFQIEA